MTEQRRLCVSLTTIPQRLSLFRPVLDSILTQSRLPDVLYVAIPYFTRKGLEYDPKEVESLQKWIKEHPNGQCVEILRPEKDYGSITKLIPALEKEQGNNTQLIICDDDKLMQPGTLKLLELKQRQYPDACISGSGWVYGAFPVRFQYIASQMIKHETCVDWTQGTDAISFPLDRVDLSVKDLLNYEIEDIPPHIQQLLKKHDDHAISYHLHKLRVLLLVIPSSKPLFIPTGYDYMHGMSQVNATGFIKEVVTVSSFLSKSGMYDTESLSVLTSHELGGWLVLSLAIYLVFKTYGLVRRLGFKNRPSKSWFVRDHHGGGDRNMDTVF